MKTLKGIFIFFGVFLLYHMIMSPFFPVDENNILQAPDWYSIVGIILAACITFFASSRKKEEKGRKKDVTSNKLGALKRVAKYPSPDDTFSIPRTRKKQTELAADLLSGIKTSVSLANKSESVLLFIEWYDEALDAFSKLIQLEKVPLKGSPSLDYYQLKDEFQWHLCDAIVREKEKTISDIKEKYRNSREFQERALHAFEADLDSVRSRFSDGTATLADEAIQEVQRLLNIQARPRPSAVLGLEGVDAMAGHEFEFWCAELLRKNGFANVVVTPGSGDQGVDVLAEKGGIKYAFQCKCYSSDLGNTPVQEVNTGKTLYHCQIGIVMTNRYFTKGAKEAAEATGVLLWDRDKLQQLMESAEL